MSRLTLISHELCPYVQRAAIVLAEKGVPVERIDIDLSNKPEWFVAISPLGKVPLLRVQGEDGTDAVLFESVPICEYLDETQRGPKLHPADPIERARHRAWFEVAGGLLGDVWMMENATEKAAFEAKREAIEKKFLLLENAVSEGPYFRGRDFSLLDAMFAPAFRYFDVFDTMHDTRVFARTPRVDAWRKHLAERQSVRSVVKANYGEALRKFLAERDSYLLRAAADA